MMLYFIERRMGPNSLMQELWTIASQNHKAIDAWIKVHSRREQHHESLPVLPTRNSARSPLRIQRGRSLRILLS
jgi:hypothetical protein